ncbi:hypothetical protein [Paraburkholderia diazotrophica]|uniref:hypothetical protein n=1 Tax=Paraburkholderia diazotrophica TaxID=667676 RepID=UPI001FEA09CC|nr:hypothetical protein [Paraburkholderia diazotrophica]
MDGFADTDDETTAISDAAPFDLGELPDSDDVLTVAARGASEQQEAECFAEYEREMIACQAAGAMFQGHTHLRGVLAPCFRQLPAM